MQGHRMATGRSNSTETTKCAICLEDYDEPKVLPCLHTFCLKCLVGHYKTKLPGQVAHCPLCRNKFSIPAEGLQSLKPNLFMDDLVCAENSTKSVPYHGSGEAVDTTYCSEGHKRYELVPVNKVATTDAEKKSGSSYCDLHETELIKLYCTDCKKVICTKCSSLTHKKCNCEDIDEMATTFRRRLSADIKIVSVSLEEIRKGKRNNEARKRELLDKLAGTKTEIRQRGDDVKECLDTIRRLVDCQVSELLEVIQSVESEEVRDIAIRQKRLQLELAARESFRNSSLELKNKGSSVDVGRAANDHHIATVQLQSRKVSEDEYYPPDVQFRASDVQSVLQDLMETQLVGTVTTTRADQLTLLHELGSKGVVCGLTELAGKIYVVCEASDKIQLFSPPYAQCQEIHVRGLKPPGDIVACRDTRVIYVSSSWSYAWNSWIWKVQGENEVNPFVKAWQPLSLSVTSRRLLVTSGCALKLYNSKGKELLSVKLALPNYRTAEHAVETQHETFIVSHSGYQHDGVSEVDRCGRVIRVCSVQLKGPYRLSLGADGRIFVVDFGNHRVLRLDEQLQLETIVLSKGEHQLSNPRRLYCVPQNSHLLVAESGAKCLKVYSLGRRWSQGQTQGVLVTRPTSRP